MYNIIESILAPEERRNDKKDQKVKNISHRSCDFVCFIERLSSLEGSQSVPIRPSCKGTICWTEGKSLEIEECKALESGFCREQRKEVE
jgi:inosine/xanthosine triphosphate pyrophosphatase family protein